VTYNFLTLQQIEKKGEQSDQKSPKLWCTEEPNQIYTQIGIVKQHDFSEKCVFLMKFWKAFLGF